MADNGYIFNEADRRALNQLRDKVGGIRGPGVQNTPGGVSFSPLSNKRAPVIPVDDTFQICALSVDGGANGSAGIASTYTYSVYAKDGPTKGYGDLSGTLLATNQPVYGPRFLQGPSVPASEGLVMKANYLGITGTTGSAPSGTGSGSGTSPSAYIIIMAFEFEGTSVQLASSPGT